ncbi:hypothetical protein FOZ61_008831 [Perkinsus olseni]|uniref:Uncharacterized protein n=1 Tax=Perkinsus olseni TaxID=32597 RepID=A0A7J6M6C9_PEROL|nr:hypothetical protein FOZ61_008831 [Perkinsus olseni]
MSGEGVYSSGRRSAMSPSMERLIREEKAKKNNGRPYERSLGSSHHPLHDSPTRSRTPDARLERNASAMLTGSEKEAPILDTQVSELEARCSAVQRQLRSTAQSLTAVCMLFYWLVNEVASGDSGPASKESLRSRAIKIILDYVTPVRQASEALLDMWSHFYYRGDLSHPDAKQQSEGRQLTSGGHQLAPTPKIPPPPCPPNQTATHLHGHYEPEGPEFRRGLQNFALTSSFSRDYWLVEVWIATAPDEPLDIAGARENIPSALSAFFNVHPQRIRELETDIRKGGVIVLTLCVADIDDPSATSGIDLLINITEAGKDSANAMWNRNDWLYEYSRRITFKPIGLAEATLKRLDSMETKISEQPQRQPLEGAAKVPEAHRPSLNENAEVLADLRRQLKAALRRNDKLEEDLSEARREAERGPDSARDSSVSSSTGEDDKEYIGNMEAALEREQGRVAHLERELEAAVRAAQRVTHDKKVKKALESELTHIRADKEKHKRERKAIMDRVIAHRPSQHDTGDRRALHAAEREESSKNAAKIAALESLLHKSLSYSYVAIKLHSLSPTPPAAGWGLEMFYAQVSTPDSPGSVDSHGAHRGDWKGRVLFLPYTEGMTFTVDVTCVWRTATGEACRQEELGRTGFIRVAHAQDKRQDGSDDDDDIGTYPLRRSTSNASTVYTDPLSILLGVYCCISGSRVQHIRAQQLGSDHTSSGAASSSSPYSGRSSHSVDTLVTESSGIGPRSENAERATRVR